MDLGYNDLWATRLDLNGANLSGTFTIVFKFADAGEVTCVNTVLAGSERNGSYQKGACSVYTTSAQATDTCYDHVQFFH